MEYAIDCSINETGDSGTVTISGVLGVAYVKEARNVLLDALKQVTNLTVDMKGLTDADLTTLQLFCSAQKYCLEKKKKILIKGGCPEIFSRIMDENGCRTGVGCPSGQEYACLWKMSQDQEDSHE